MVSPRLVAWGVVCVWALLGLYGCRSAGPTSGLPAASVADSAAKASAGGETESGLAPSVGISGINTPALFDKLGLPLPTGGSVEHDGMAYGLGDPPHGVTMEFYVGVFPNAGVAHTAFQMVITPLAPVPLDTDSPGDEFVYWRRVGAGTEDRTRIKMRRGNVVISTWWRGPQEEAFDFARDLDHILATDLMVAPVGPVEIPQVAITAPAEVVAGAEFKLSFLVTRGRAVQAAGVAFPRDGGDGVFLDGDTRRPTLKGVVRGRLPKAGTFDLEVPFASCDNVVFVETVRVNVGPARRASGR